MLLHPFCFMQNFIGLGNESGKWVIKGDDNKLKRCPKPIILDENIPQEYLNETLKCLNSGVNAVVSKRDNAEIRVYHDTKDNTFYRTIFGEVLEYFSIGSYKTNGRKVGYTKITIKPETDIAIVAQQISQGFDNENRSVWVYFLKKF